ncbi:MAG: S26 family signal peptidase [Fibrobacter sp.]|nr:S26 family signal peptidase [Fibrobacter sp.]
MSALTRKVKRLQRRNSQGHVFFLFFLLIVFFGLATLIRYYILVPVQVMDSSMSPKFKEQSVHWMCKLPQCIDQVNYWDIVWANSRSNETIVRKILAMPGDSIEITDKGRVITPHRNIKWKGEDSFIQSRAFYVPKAGDTLLFDQLNDVEQDYVISYLREKGENIIVKTTLWQGDREINIDRVGATKIANRQVSLNEINFLPWQDRYLIELQIRQSEPGNSPIKLKRELFRGKKKEEKISLELDEPKVEPDSSISDTAVAQADSFPPPKPAPLPEDSQSQENSEETIITEQINQILIEDDCYFLACEKGTNCLDSRELGFFTRDRLIGKHLVWPDKVNDRFIEPAMVYVRIVQSAAAGFWNSSVKFFTDTYDSTIGFYKTLFKSEEKKDDKKDSEDVKPES